MIGKTLAHYEIVALLGKGGMGEVYRARDTRLNRDVALKVLPAEFARDPQRMGRFAREAQVLAALNHPSIAGIHGLEEDGPIRALAMELVEGETLQARLARGPMSLDECARIGLELAEAIEAAHEKGIVHRDLKPANVMLTAEGKVKVLDFGLAKALEGEPVDADPANSPTLTAAATRAGIILGTAAYMSPEQATGSTCDRRADIWSYGVVLSEMISGRRQFAGETVSHTLASVLKDEPAWDSFRSAAPDRVVRLLRRCLHKDPKRRLQSIGEARVLWEEYLADPASFQTTSPGVAAAPASRARPVLPWILTAVALVALALVWFSDRTPTIEDGMTRRLMISIAGTTDFDGTNASPPAISPDGRRIVFGMSGVDGSNRLWLRSIGDFETRPLEGSSGASYPFWSPDGEHLGFFHQGRLRRMEISSGRTQTVGGDGAIFARGADWTDDGHILFAPNSNTGIWIVSADGGEPRQLTHLDPDIVDASHRWPVALPDGDRFLFLWWSNDLESLEQYGGLYLASISGAHSPRRIVPDASSASYANTGHLLVVQDNNLVALPFDVERGEITGTGLVVASGVLMNRNNGQAAFSVSEEGTLVYAPDAGSMPAATLHWSDRSGARTATVIEPMQMFPRLRLSPDAQRAAVSLPGTTAEPSIWVLDLTRGARTRLSPPAPHTYDSPVWSPDGSRVCFVSTERGTWDVVVKNADGSGNLEPLVVSGNDKSSADWVGDRLLYWEGGVGSTGYRFFLHDLTTDEASLIFEAGESIVARFSPDATHVVFHRPESDRNEVFVQNVATGATSQVSTAGGRDPRWSKDGREILFVDLEWNVMSIEVTEDDGGMRLGRPRVLFRMDRSVMAWDPTPDHQRFLIAVQPRPESEPLHVVLGWDLGL